MRTHRITTLRTTLAALALLLAPAAAACSSADPAGPDPASDAPGDLALTTKTATSVTGRFTKDGATIAFTFALEGADKHVTMTTTAGAPLVEATIHRDGGHTVRVLGDRLVVDSDAGAPPTFTGDRAAEKDLHDMPESACIEAIEGALAAAGVDAALLPTQRAGGGLELESVGYGNCDTWVPEYGSATCGSTFFGWTNLYVTNCNAGDALFNINGDSLWISSSRNPSGGCNWDPSASSTPVNANGCASCNFGGWWWGANINFQNIVALDANGRFQYGVPVHFGHGTGH